MYDVSESDSTTFAYKLPEIETRFLFPIFSKANVTVMNIFAHVPYELL
jgi:hypothetical protein